ncbi:MAG: sugar phosphate nucleotidyltransferase [Dehalococcoidia bacterium]
MKVVFLCGGAGKRMLPITEDKFLLKFLGNTLLEHQIEQALAAGLDDIVIVGNQRNMGRLSEIIRNFPSAGIGLALQRGPRGMAVALRSAQSLLEGQILVVNPSDVFERTAYSAILEEGRKGGATSYILGAKVESYFPGGYLIVNEEREIQHIVEKPERGERPSDVVNMVVHLHSDAQALFRCLEVESTRDDAYEQALEGMIKDGHRLKLVDYGDFWGPIKYPWHIFAVMEHFLGRSQGGIAKTAKVSERATIEGDVIIDEGVTVLENAVIRGPCYIGKNSVIGNNVLIRDRSHIGENCVVGFSTEIKHSYIGDGCWFHRNYIGDSIIADRCSFGAGTIIANLRFDEREVKIGSGDETIDTGLEKLGVIMGADSKTGINVSIMPGARIGPNSIVGSHVMLPHDLEPNRIILLDTPNRVIERRVGSD